MPPILAREGKLMSPRQVTALPRIDLKSVVFTAPFLPDEAHFVALSGNDRTGFLKQGRLSTE